MKRFILVLQLLAPTVYALSSPDSELDSLRDNFRQRLSEFNSVPDDALAIACADLVGYWCYRSNDSSRYY